MCRDWLVYLLPCMPSSLSMSSGISSIPYSSGSRLAQACIGPPSNGCHILTIMLYMCLLYVCMYVFHLNLMHDPTSHQSVLMNLHGDQLVYPLLAFTT
ncbi:hypothetical protein F5Y15DRAFT_124400 [Xylariaceae sp. FL0016]|nr:hypothetical protein F5Y15DRAFT_124400 [Xylariaceae sp. FL0016]